MAVTGDGTLHLTSVLAPGDWCSLHWDWVCDRLEPAQVRALRHCSRTQLATVNDAPATVLAGHRLSGVLPRGAEAPTGILRT